MTKLEKLQGEVRVTRGEACDYLGMILNFRQREKVIVDMTEHAKETIKIFRCPGGELQNYALRTKFCHIFSGQLN